MNSLISRVSYLNGLVEGLYIDKNSKDGKIISEVVNILNDMAEEIQNLKDTTEDMENYMDAMDEDLDKLENEVYDDNCDYDDDDFINVKCPHCGETVYIDSNLIDDKESITCPNCSNSISLGQLNSCSCVE